jgi:ATP-binding cassette, subfamily G (WHITE), member 2, SNQ2
MTDTPNNKDTRPESPNQPFDHNQEAHSGSLSDTNVDVENVDEERGKDFIQKRLTLTFQNVIVRVTAPDEVLGETLWSWVDPRQLGGLFKRTHKPKRVSSSQSATLTRCHLLTC